MKPAAPVTSMDINNPWRLDERSRAGIAGFAARVTRDRVTAAHSTAARRPRRAFPILRAVTDRHRNARTLITAWNRVYANIPTTNNSKCEILGVPLTKARGSCYVYFYRDHTEK